MAHAPTLTPLRFARLLRGISAKELAGRVERTPAWVSQLESGSKEMPPESLPIFAAALDVPENWLVQGPVQADAVLHFRHKKRTKAAQRERVTARAVIARMLISELEQEFEELYQPGLPTLDLPDEPGAPSRVQAIERAAGDLRVRWNMGEGPIPDVVRLVEVHGIWVIELPPEERNVDAFSWWSDAHAFIALNPVPLDGSDELTNPDGPRNAYRERFNTAHELGHLLLHRDVAEDGVGTREVEGEAHRFAAAFLVPASQWRACAPRSVDWRDYRELAHRWGVSASMLLRRSRDLGILDEQRYQGAMIRMSAEIGRREEGLHLPIRGAERPARLEAHLSTLAGQGDVSMADLAARMGLNVDDLAFSIGLQPPDTGPTGKVVQFRRPNT